MEGDEERKKKLEAGKAKLAQFRQRKAHSDGQHAPKKQKKKKKASNSKEEELVQESLDLDQSQEDASSHSCQRGAAATADYVTVRTLHSDEMIKHDQTYPTELESEISTTADDYSSEEEEFEFGENYSEHGMQHSLTRLEMMENELAAKQQEIEELNRELEEMRAAYGTEGLQQLQEFEAAIKKRDDIITQLTANLQQARKEKDETMREFLELTEQSQKLQIQFQHLQASEALRNTSHSSTAADLLQAKQQILVYQQQLEDQEQLLKNYQIKNEEFKQEFSLLQQKIADFEMEKYRTEEDSTKKKLQEKEAIIEELEAKIIEEEENIFILQKNLSAAEKSLEEVKEEVFQKNEEIHNVKAELANSKQKERQSSDEIKQLMGTVEELQKRCHKDNQYENDIIQRMELDTQRKLAELRAELEEVHGQQIVQMKQELVREHTIEIEKLLAQQKADLERTLNLRSGNTSEDQIHLMNIAINELNLMLQDANYQREKVRQDLSQQLELLSSEKSSLQNEIEDLHQELDFAREQIQKAKQTISEKDSKLHETETLQSTVEDLKAQLASASEIKEELELKHEAEVTNYKIKLEMLEREKDAVLDRMAESQEAELERLRTQLLFSHEEELSKLKYDLQREHRLNTEMLKENMVMQAKQQLDNLRDEMSKKLEAMQFENDNLVTKQDELTLEISRLKDLHQSVVNSKTEEMMLQIHNLQKEIEVLRQEEKEKGTLEQEVQELQLKIELLERQMKEQEDSFQKTHSLLETQNNVLVELQSKLRKYAVKNVGKSLTYTDVSGMSEDFDFLRTIENLVAENEKLIKEDAEHKEEIERLKNTFSFAERNLEHNYKELQEKYTSLLKIKLDLEEDKNRQEAEYKAKLQALIEVQHFQEETSVVRKTESKVPQGKKEKILRSETFDVEEVIEKDTTELMEKLEVTQREKLELSSRLSDLSEQLNIKQNQICQLNEEVASLKQDKKYISARCKELENIVHLRLEENMNSCEPKIQYSNGELGKVHTTVHELEDFVSNSSKEYERERKERKEKSVSSQILSHHVSVEKAVQQKLNTDPGLHLDNFPVSDGFAEESSYASLVQGENKLQEQLEMLKAEQNDLKLQMEAQRICLSLVYSAHVDQVRESLENEKENALSALKEELQFCHAQELSELKKSQQDSHITKQIKTGEEDSWMHLERLNKMVAEACSKLTQYLLNIPPGNVSSATEYEVSEANKPSSVLISRAEAQVLQETLQNLLSKIMEEYHRLLDYHAQIVDGTKKGEEHWAQCTDYCGKENGNLPQNVDGLPTSTQDHTEIKVNPTNWEDIENFKSQLEEQHAQDIERLRSYFHQQLRETEERYAAEIAHLESRLQKDSRSSECFSVSVGTNVNEAKEKEKDTRNNIQQRADMTAELSNEGGIIELLEKQYQEKLLQEIAQVVVTMSIQFAQKNELERIANLKEEEMALMVPPQSEQENNFSRESSVQLDTHRSEKRDIEEFKSLSREISEEYGDTLSLEGHIQPEVKPEVLELHNFDSSLPIGCSSNDSELMQNRSLVTSDVSTSSIVASSQISLYEERLEDMRQELVRQYQEHQQATEILKQGHMEQMEWQKENQELLLAELDRLKVQLAESATLDNENVITEREQALLEELESLKKQLMLGRENLLCELIETSTQTQDESTCQTETKDHISEGEDGVEKNEETYPNTLGKESCALQKAYNRLLKILLEIVKTTAAVEETIGRHVVGLLDRSSKCQLPFKGPTWEGRTEDPIKPSVHVEYEAEKALSSYHGSTLEGGDRSMWSEVTDEGLELTQYLGVEIDSKNEEIVLNISSRLQAAVEKLLETINETTNQLEHAKVTQTELMRESFKQEQEITELLKCQEELQERFEEEVKAREQLALELSKAENLIDGYADEKSLLEKQIQEKTDAIDHLEQELLCTGNKLQELEAERQQLQEEKELFFRQKDAMKADAGPVEQRLVDAAVDAASQAELLAETEKLMKEKIEVQRQAEKEYDYLQKQVKVLETDIEEQVNRFLELEQEKNTELTDLRQQNQALEKQLEKTKKFLDEQAIDREHERDVFQQEIQKLEQQLKIPQRLQPVNEHQNREVEQLTNHLKEKTDKCSELLLAKEQLQRDVQERNEEIEKLECRIRELEQALMISADSLQKVEERKQFGCAAKRGQLPLEAQLQAEQEAVDRKEKEIINLEEQLEQFREELENKIEEVQQLHMQLEIQQKESATRQQELEQENKLFKEDMEKMQLAIQTPEDTSIKGRHPVAGTFIQVIQQREQQINELHEQISKLQQQLETATDNKVIEENNEYITELEAQIEYLKSDQERVKQNCQQEVEELNEVIETLQKELTNIGHKTLDISLTQEDVDNIKHQLDVALAEKEALVKQMENNDVKLSVTKNELKEAKLKISTLEKELNALKEEHERMEGEHETMRMKSGMSEARPEIKEKNENLEVVNQEKNKTLENEIPLGYVGENAEASSSMTDAKMQLLQKSLNEKNLELKRCYSQLQDLKEQSQAESRVFKQRIKELEETLKQKVPVVAEQSQVLQGVKAEEVNSTAEDATPRLPELLKRLSEVESQLASAQNSLQIEKSKVEIAQKEAEEKEERLAELMHLLAEVEEKHKREKVHNSEEGEAQSTRVGTDLSENKQRSEVIPDPELERVKAESAAAKEELNSYKEKVEKLQEQLIVKESSLLCLQEELRETKDKLTQAEMEIADHLRRGVSTEKSEGLCANRTNASCQTDKALHINSCNQTSQLLVKNEGIQIDLQSGCFSEEVAEIIREFNEKIDQMQELHAAEIMDMESRHISESDALKRELFIAVQELTEECNSLKDVIEALRDKEGMPHIIHSASSNVRDGCSSDSSSDWSQGAYIAANQGSDMVSEELGDEGEASTEFLPKKIKGLLRAIHQEGVQVLSLSQYPYHETDGLPLQEGTESWLEERKAFLSTVASLKNLIAKMQIHRDTEMYEGSAAIPDWRSELLYAIQQVFQNEKDVLLAAFQTEMVEAGVRDVMGLIEHLEKRLQEQVTYQKTAMECIQNADRRSLLMEINLLHTQLNNSRTDPKRELETEPKCQELVGYNMEMQIELSNTKDKAAELLEQLNSEKMVVEELKNELGQTKLELETTLKAQHKHLRDLEAIRNELKGKTAELDKLKDAMESEQKKSRELQWALEKEKTKVERSEERGKEELEDLKYALETEQQKVKELSNLLELERELSNDLQKKMEAQEALNAAQLSQERSCNSELQVLLESERYRVLEVSSALEREKELCAQLQVAERKIQDGTLTPAEELLRDLQKQLDEKHDRIVSLVSETERYKLESVQLKQEMETERQIQRKTLRTEQEANILAQKKVHELESKVEDLQWQLGEQRQQVHQLQGEGKRWQEMVQELQQKEQRKEEVKEEDVACQNLNENTWDPSDERTRKWVFQQKMGGAETTELSYSALIGMGGGDSAKESQNLQMVRQKLKNVSSKLKQLANKAACRLPFEKPDDEDFVRIQNNIEEVLVQLQALSGLPSLETEMNSDLTSPASLTGRLLKQNAELTGLVSRLSEEKNNLRNGVMKLEEELRRCQQRGPCGDSTFRLSPPSGGNMDALIASEKEIWNKEKLSLQHSLKQAEAELSKLRAELRNEAFLRELGSDSENAALKRIYGRYLRAESFRKALIYQKKYLLLLLGGFQECEEATLSLIARMGGQPSYTDLEVITHRSKGFTRFRSVVRVLIAISRMKFLVRRWHRVTGYSLIGINRDGFGHNTGNELRPDSLSGGLELYREHRPSSYRSRSELESLRSPLCYQPRFQGIHSDLSPVSLACSQLQNYDPDRALTDYINRLEALQRRLGTVHSASVPFSQLHSGIRR